LRVRVSIRIRVCT